MNRAALNEIRPLDVLLYLMAVLSFFFVVALVFPANGIKLSNSITLTFPTVAELMHAGSERITEAFTIDCNEQQIVNFSSSNEPNQNVLLPLKCTPEQLKQKLPEQPIEYPDGNRAALGKMFAELTSLRTDKQKLVRLLHYGDSQIEADRMTLVLRQQLQRELGGGGVGYMALDPHIPINPTVKITLSHEWKVSTPAVKYKQSKPLHVGHLLSNISCAPKAGNPAWIQVVRRPLKTYPPLRFTRVKVMMSNSKAPCRVEVRTPSKLLYAADVAPTGELQQLCVNVGASRENITLRFAGGNPEVEGIALDYSNGAAFDNIPLRSSSGVDFDKADAAYLAAAYRALDVKGIVLQFGANVVPKIVSSYAYYEKQFYEQLVLLRRLAPDASILVVGVTDMARRGTGGTIKSYPNIEKIRDAQRSAALRAGCAFWDAYEAMGGRNSIVSWAYAQPSLASKDFCHFSNAGATIMGELLYRSLRSELQMFERGVSIANRK